MTTAALELRDVLVREHNHTRLHSTSLAIYKGQITAIIGANGSGKSTLLAVLSGEITPASGSVSMNGLDITTLNDKARARRRALLAQHTPTTFAFSVREVVGWGRFCWAGSPEQIRDGEVVDSIITQLNLQHLADRPLTQLSAGEQARVHLARVLAQEAPIVMLDEADADLDLGARVQLDHVVRTLRDQGTTVVLVTHDLSRVNVLADVVVGMDRGRIASQGSSLTVPDIQSLFGVPAREAARTLGAPYQ